MMIQTVSGIETIVSGHLKILLRDMLEQQFDEIHGRESFAYKRVIFMFIVMESYIFTIIRIDPGKSNNRTTKITADIFDGGFGFTEIRFSINVEAILIFTVNFRFCLFKRRTDPFFELVQKDSLKGFTEIGIIEVIDSTPETVIRKTAFV